MSIRYLTAGLAIAWLSTAAFAKDGRDFAGFYSLTNAIVDGDQVRVTLSLRLSNYSGADLKDASIAVRAAFPATEIVGTYSPIDMWRDGADQAFAIHLTVPRGEYQTWDERHQPAIIIINRNEEGRELQRAAQVSRRAQIPLENRTDQ